jgi:hypothetical protein
MNKRRTSEFSRLDFHDDNLMSININLSAGKKNATRIDFYFRDDSTRIAKILSFRGCANIRYIMDFDVVAANWFAQTKAATSNDDHTQMKRFVTAQKRHWRVKYMPPLQDDSPVRKKLSSIRSYGLFRVAFFGGTAEVLAKSFIVQKPSKRLRVE